jgi:protein O-GlcNAc transferase
LALAHLVVGLEYTCQWDKLDLYHPLLDQATRIALDDGRRPDEDPMLNIRRCDDVTVNQAVGRAWSRYRQNRARHSGIQLIHSPAGRQYKKITIGYLSYDFRNHPVAHQLFPLFGMHDRNRFRTVAYSIGPDDGSFFRKKIVAGCDDFVDISSQGLSEAVKTIYDHQIDILVDLMGHSHHNRMEILALRPAPIQVGYLGFLSTTGAPFIDYLVTDAKVVPKDHEPFFDEKLLRMPHCYQFSHAGLIGTETDTRRQDWGLPDTGFVFCCFNTVYKIDRELFDTWMRILLRIPGSVLWLNGGHQMARRQMQSRARMLGIDPIRLVFCEKIALEDHLRRIRLADLALDTIRYNGGATTANAIGSGVPVITVMGRHWVSRMSASQLIAAGLPDLVFPSISSYEHAAVELALNENKLRSVRERLKENVKGHPLFDSQGFVRQLEAGFEIIWQRFLDGSKPDHVEIAKSALASRK